VGLIPVRASCQVSDRGQEFEHSVAESGQIEVYLRTYLMCDRLPGRRLFRLSLRTCILAFAFLSTVPAADVDLAGSWQFSWTPRAIDRPYYGRLKLKAADGGWTGTSNATNVVTVSLKGDAVELRCIDQGKDCGRLTGHFADGVLKLSGSFYGNPEAKLTANRQPPPAAQPTRHAFAPTVFHNTYSSQIAAALTIHPGDTVHTITLDATGVNAKGVQQAVGGNPLTGPFYVQGAWPGDTLVIKLNRIRLNRNSAVTYAENVSLSALDPTYVSRQKRVENFDSTWILDPEKGVAMLTKPTERLKNFQVKLSPMLGCIGVAPRNAEAFGASRLGAFGGNLDYNQVLEGTTVYLPVFHPGALLFIGDAHAAQGDGELMGTGLETSMQVEFSVDLKESGQRIVEPHAESDEYFMVMGPGTSLEDSIQKATTGMSKWLALAYGLNTAEIAMVLGSSMRYDIARSRDHVVARLAKSALKQIPASR
jgi:amidase